MHKQLINVNYKIKYKYFLLTFDDAYVKMGGGITKSIIKNTKENVCFIVLTESLSDSSIARLKSYNIPFIIYYIKTDIIKYDSNIHPNWPKISVARLLAPFIIEEECDYLYYLDCDILCINSLDDLFNLKINTSIAMCPEVAGNIRIQCEMYSNNNLYCNSGFIIFNMNKYKSSYTLETICKDFNEMVDKLSFPDQDFLNVYFKDDVTYLNPIKYNNQLYEYIGFKNLKHCLLDNTIFIHFSVGKPWKNNCCHKIAKTYKKYTDYDELKSIVNIAMFKHNILYLPRLIKRTIRKVISYAK